MASVWALGRRNLRNLVNLGIFRVFRVLGRVRPSLRTPIFSCKEVREKELLLLVFERRLLRHFPCQPLLGVRARFTIFGKVWSRGLSLNSLLIGALSISFSFEVLAFL